MQSSISGGREEFVIVACVQTGYRIRSSACIATGLGQLHSEVNEWKVARNLNSLSPRMETRY